MNSYKIDASFFKYDKTFASDLYLKYKLWPWARVCISDTDRLLMHVLSSTYYEGHTEEYLSGNCANIAFSLFKSVLTNQLIA